MTYDIHQRNDEENAAESFEEVKHQFGNASAAVEGALFVGDEKNACDQIDRKQVYEQWLHR